MLNLFALETKLCSFRLQVGVLLLVECPDSSVVEHLHGKQKVVGSIPILGKAGLLERSRPGKNYLEKGA